MLKKILYILILLLITISVASTLKITNKENIISTKYNLNIFNKKVPIGSITIPKINLEEDLYSINSSENNVEKNITILNESISPDKEESIMYLAAHSGTGKIAYFEQLDELSINDIVILKYKNNKYEYIVKEMWEERKSGYIHVRKDDKKQLILTTCSPKNKNYQLIVNCTIKES